MSSFDINVIPPDQRSVKHVEAHKEIWKATQNIWCVYNPTDTVFIVKDNFKVTHEHWDIPNKDTDVGHGKGMQHVPEFIMKRYRDQMGTQLIYAKWHKDWEEQKKNYPRAEWGITEERIGLRLTDEKEWTDVIPLLVKGMVRRYEGDSELADEVNQLDRSNPNESMSDAVMRKLGMTEMELGAELPAKDDFINQIS